MSIRKSWRSFPPPERGSGSSDAGLRVLGVDPGTVVTGWAVVQTVGSGARRVASGVIAARRAAPLAERLHRIHDSIRRLIEDHRVRVVGLEKAFVARNVQSAFRLGEARGVVLLAAAEAGLPVFEYSPAAVKQAVVGYGRADKPQIARGIAMLLAIAPPERPDEADALAVALCHLQGMRIAALMERAR